MECYNKFGRRLKMKKIIYLTICILLLTSVYAINKPPVNSIPLAVIEQPVEPGTGTEGQCEPWEIKDEYCDGNIRHYTQCIKTRLQ